MAGIILEPILKDRPMFKGPEYQQLTLASEGSEEAEHFRNHEVRVSSVLIILFLHTVLHDHGVTI